MPLSESHGPAFVLFLDDLEEGIRRLVTEMTAGRLDTIYIDPVRCGTVHAFGARLSDALRSENLAGSALTDAEVDSVRHLRGSYTFRAETDPRVSMYPSEDLDGWTVICEEEVLFAEASAARQVYVKPMPTHWDDALFMVRSQLTAFTIWPAGRSVAALSEFHVRTLGE